MTTAISSAVVRKALFTIVALLLIFQLCLFSPLGKSSFKAEYFDKIANTSITALPNTNAKPPPGTFKQAEPPRRKLAFATLLSGPSSKEDEDDLSKDNYFMATRLLTYQLLHAPETRSRSDIPFLVLVGQNVSEAKRERLQKDGATVVPVEPLHFDWVTPSSGHWSEVMTKMRLWDFTDYDGICILDGDTVLTKPIDGVFDDPAAQPFPVGNKRDEKAYKADEGELPKEYVLAAIPEPKPDHAFPPTEENHDYFNKNYLNSGFIVLKPDRVLFDHYLKILSIPDRFNPDMPEQNLLNYVHRRDGNMPWKEVTKTWNIHYPKMADVNGGVASLHDKFWHPQHEEMRPLLQSWRYKMEGFYEAWDQFAGLFDTSDRW